MERFPFGARVKVDGRLGYVIDREEYGVYTWVTAELDPTTHHYGRTIRVMENSGLLQPA
jgi:hypothetical protein